MRAVGLLFLVGLALPAAPLTLSDFSTGGFDYTFDDFTSTHDPLTQTVRVTDLNDGWGGAGFNFASPVDLSGLVDQYMRVDYRIEADHRVDQFVIELYDTADRSIKFYAATEPYSGAGYRSYYAGTNFGSPVDGIGDFQNFDYTQVRNWQVLGQFGSTDTFDLSFDQVSIQEYAYSGQADDAAWRTQADTQIDQIRKADMLINVRLADGRAAPGAGVDIAQQQHAFGFGTAVASRLLTGAQADATYQDKVREHFNLAVTENSLKWPAWEGDYGTDFSPTVALQSLNWLEANDIEARGHVMVWPSFNNLPANAASLASNPTALRQAVLDHIAEIGGAVGDRVFEWDVVNEPRTNNDLMALFGDEVMAEWFNAADAASNARLFLNEYGLVTGGHASEDNRQIHHGYIQGLLNGNAPLEGLGIQGHFRPEDLTGIEQVWEIFDEFGAYGLPIAITEFDFETTDRQLQADYSADFLRAAFAHESVSEFLMWGFWAGAHWRPDAAIYDENWNLRPHGQAMLDLIYDEWWTDESLLANAAGQAQLRGFKGEYEITVQLGNMTHTVTVTLGDDGEIIDITLPGGAMGDMDFDGDLDENDALAFVLAVTNQTQYESLYGLDPLLTGDVNLDGVFNLSDLEPFAGLLPGSAAATLRQAYAVPEPITALSWASVMILLAGRHGPKPRR